MSGKATGAAAVGMTVDASGSGYWELGASGEVFSMGSAKFEGALIDTAPWTHGAAVAAIANSQVGKTDPYAYGPTGSDWCAYFTSWAWRSAGVPIPEIGPASDVGVWALQHDGAILPPTARREPGDAVQWVRAGTMHVWPDEAALDHPNIEHVNVVTQVLANGEIVTIGGNESGAVRRTGPFSPRAASSYFGQSVYGFVRPPA